MAVSLKPLRAQAIVITGASSGIGLATAEAAAKQGARVLLVARNESALAAATARINKDGGEAAYAVADVAERGKLDQVAQVAKDKFGGFDTWVNNAGVGIWGRLEEVSEEDSRRLFDTNFWGLVNGSLIAAAALKDRGGAIINLGSVASDISFPLQGMYCASKHAIKGFTDGLRVELEEARAPISVTLIKPAAIGTPFPQHARNYTGHEAKLPEPIYPPEEVAAAILYAAQHPVRDLYVGGSGAVISMIQGLAPRLMDWISSRAASRSEVTSDPARHPQGALHAAGEDGDRHGKHPGPVRPFSIYTRAAIHPVTTSVLLTALAATAGLAVAANQRRSETMRALLGRPYF